MENLDLREEIANSISHGLGLVLAIVAVPILVLAAIRGGSTHFVVGVSVFGGTMVLLYLASTLYHSLTHEAAKAVCRVFDHTAIFLLIAGTYTPFSLGVLRGPWGWSLLAVIWTLAIVGITLKIRKRTRDVDSCAGDLVDLCGRCCVHRRACVLCVRAHALQPFHLAPLRHRRHDLPLLRGALVRVVNFTVGAALCGRPVWNPLFLFERTHDST